MEALSRSDKSIHLVVAGEFWEDAALYEQQISRLGLANRVTLLNKYIPDEEAHVIFSAVDALIAPYVGGTQSGVVELANGYGLPVMMTDIIAEGAQDRTLECAGCPCWRPRCARLCHERTCYNASLGGYFYRLRAGRLEAYGKSDRRGVGLRHNRPPILIVGLPRSGTTWVGKVFSSDQNARYIFEPDNEKLSPLAWLCKREIHRFPYLTAQDASPAYSHLWRAAFSTRTSTWLSNRLLGGVLKGNSAGVEVFIGNKSGLVYVDESMHRVGSRGVQPYSPQKHPYISLLAKRLADGSDLSPSMERRIIIKSVHASLCADWIADNFPAQIVIILRNPYSLYASYKRLKMPDSFRNLMFQENLQRDRLKYMPDPKKMLMAEKEDAVAFQIMLMYKIIEKQISSHPEWLLISHDRLCITPNESYHSIFGSLNLNWSDSTENKINSLNTTGGSFAPKRISSQQPSKWKSEMGASERTIIHKWIDQFELQNFLQTHISLD